jgi:hypothetical protein
VNESVHLRHQLAEERELVKSTKSSYDHHFEKIEVSRSTEIRRIHRACFLPQQEEFENQRKLHANIEQVVADLAESRREYDLLQVEYQKTLIANQQAGEQCDIFASLVPLRSFFSADHP